MPSNLLVLENVAFQYPGTARPLFSGLSATIAGGERLGIWGSNGSGKTTLLQLLSGAYSPTEGRVLLNGAPVDAVRNAVAVVSADFDMFDYLTVEENVRFFLEFYGVPADPDALAALLERYGLTAHARKSVAEASRGIRRKTQLVTALLMQPRLLLADEPLDGLDEPSQARWLEDADALGVDGSIVVTVLHDLDRLRKHTDRQLLLSPEVEREPMRLITPPRAANGNL